MILNGIKLHKGIVFWVLWFLVVGNLALATQAWAFISSGGKNGKIGHYNYVSKEKTRQRVVRKIPEEKREREQEWERFLRQHGTGWEVTRDKFTGLPHRAVQTNPSSSEALWRNLFWSEDDLINYVYDFIKENNQLLGLDNPELELVRILKRGNIWYIDFQQKYQGLLVCGSRLRFEFDENYRLLSFGVETYPGISLDTTPLIDETQAKEIVNQHINSASDKNLEPPAINNEQSENNEQTRLVILPLIFGQEVAYSLAWLVETSHWQYFVDAQSGEVLQRYTRLKQAISGQIRGSILPNYYNDTPVEVPFRDQKIYLLNKSQAILKETLDSDPGWDTEGLWEYGKPVPVDLANLSAQGHAGPPDPASGKTGSNLYGYNLKGDYTNLLRPKYLTTHLINCDGKYGTVLRFWRWLGVQKEYYEDDYGYKTNYDRASIGVSNDSGLSWTTIWSNGSSQIEDATYKKGTDNIWYWGDWNLQTFDLSRYADNHHTVYIRWGMGTTDGSGVFCGWNIDDIELLESRYTYTDPNGDFAFPADANSPDWPKTTLTAKISGLYAEVYNEDTQDALYVDENIVNPDYVSQYTWSAAQDIPSGGYDELNVYYHINKMIQYIKTVDPEYVGMDSDRKGPIKVITRWGENYSNAFWSPDHIIYFGEGDSIKDGYRNFALFSDIIYHEYTHAVTESFYSFFMPLSHLNLGTTTTDTTQTGPILTTEMDAMHEAFSDYWAATVTNDYLIGEGDIWVGHSYVRTLDNAYKYPDDYGDDPYANSLILSGAMWDVRTEFGQEVADTLFHFARYSGDTTFADYLASVLSQDRRVYGGLHLERLKEIFGDRGISKAPVAPTRLIATAGSTVIRLTWDAVDDPDVNGYYVFYRTENDIETSREDPSVKRDVGKEISYVVEGLTNQTTYVLKVTACNIYGTESEYSDYVYATPYDVSQNSKYSQGSSSNSNDSFFTSCFIQSLLRF